VQDSIQRFRPEVQAAGLLTSDDKQVVIAEGHTIRIMPAQPQVIYVPMYDGPVLAAAIAARRSRAGYRCDCAWQRHAPRLRQGHRQAARRPRWYPLARHPLSLQAAARSAIRQR
jgi:hypothetical protein